MDDLFGTGLGGYSHLLVLLNAATPETRLCREEINERCVIVDSMADERKRVLLCTGRIAPSSRSPLKLALIIVRGALVWHRAHSTQFLSE